MRSKSKLRPLPSNTRVVPTHHSTYNLSSCTAHYAYIHIPPYYMLERNRRHFWHRSISHPVHARKAHTISLNILSPHTHILPTHFFTHEKNAFHSASPPSLITKRNNNIITTASTAPMHELPTPRRRQRIAQHHQRHSARNRVPAIGKRTALGAFLSRDLEQFVGKRRSPASRMRFNQSALRFLLCRVL